MEKHTEIFVGLDVAKARHAVAVAVAVAVALPGALRVASLAAGLPLQPRLPFRLKARRTARARARLNGSASAASSGFRTSVRRRYRPPRGCRYQPRRLRRRHKPTIVTAPRHAYQSGRPWPWSFITQRLVAPRPRLPRPPFHAGGRGCGVKDLRSTQAGGRRTGSHARSAAC